MVSMPLINTLRKNSLAQLIIALIVFSLLYAYFTTNTPLRPAGAINPRDYCVTPERPSFMGLRLEGDRLFFQASYTVLMGRGDNMTFDISPPSAPWTYNLVVVDAVTGEVLVNYTTNNPTTRFIPPVFIAPRSTIYYVSGEAVVKLGENVDKACLEYHLAVYPAMRADALNAIYSFTAILLVLLVAVLVSNPRVNYRGFLGELVVNTKFMWLWVFMPLVFLVVYSTLLDTSPIVKRLGRNDLENKLIVLLNYREFTRIDFFVLYGTISAMLYTLLFTYRREIGEEKLRDTMPYPRWKRYFSLIVTHVVLVYTPLYIVSVLHLFKQVPNIALHDPYVFSRFLCHLFIVTFFIYSLVSVIPLVISILSPRTSISMVASVTLFLLLVYPTPVSTTLLSLIPYFKRPGVKSLGDYAADLVKYYLLAHENIYKYYFTWDGNMGRVIDYLYGTPLLYIALVLLCKLFYTRRENP